MGIFDRLRATGPTVANGSGNRTEASEQEATHSIEEGHVLEAEGKLAEAMQCYLHAIQLAPNPARAHLNRGNVLLLQGDLPGALEAFRTAIEHKPDYAGAYYNIGNALLGNGQFDEAVANYRRALEINPDYAEVHCSLGIAFKELGQLESAEKNFRKALEINPDLTEANINLGNVLQSLWQFESAVTCYRHALKIEPDYAEVHNYLGSALQSLGQLESAVASCRRALEIKPDYAGAHCSLGLALQNLGYFKDAAASCRRALELKPDLVEAHTNLGITLQDLGQLEDAVACYRRALEIKPDFAVAHSNLGGVLQSLGLLESAIESYRQALEIKPDYAEAHSNLLFVLNYVNNHTPSYYLDQARQYGQMVARKVTTRFSAWQCAARPERLRVGLVSGDLFRHPVGYFLAGLLAHINPDHIELIAYPTHHKEDELTARIRPYFSAWKPLIGKSDEAAARLIHADGVNVLIDVSVHSAHNRLPVFAWKPAPVQVSWLGLPSTTGVAEMDYVLGDPYAIPAEDESHFSETVWRMPESCLCLSVPLSTVNVAPLPALSAGYVTFGSFNNLTKMNDAVVAVWVRILKAVPNSRLLLKTKQLSDPVVCEKTRQRFTVCGIAPDRLLLGGTLASADDHLAMYNKVDIALDTFPYTGVTTSFEALWMGVPVLSMRGNRFLTRTAGSIAHNAGLPEWIAGDEDDYVAKAMAFAYGLDRLAALRASLRQQVLASPLFDAPRFARNFENALREMWQIYQAAQEKPT